MELLRRLLGIVTVALLANGITAQLPWNTQSQMPIAVPSGPVPRPQQHQVPMPVPSGPVPRPQQHQVPMPVPSGPVPRPQQHQAPQLHYTPKLPQQQPPMPVPPGPVPRPQQHQVPMPVPSGPVPRPQQHQVPMPVPSGPVPRPQQHQAHQLHYTPKLPQQQPQQHPQTPLAEDPFERCQVAQHEKVSCGAGDVSAEQCQTVDCCFDGHHCYYGKTVTVQCTKDGQFVVVVSRDTTVPHIDLNSVSVLETDDVACGPVGTTSSFAIFHFPVTACGTTMTSENDAVVYENVMSSSYEVEVGPRGSITRDSHFELLFQCRYSGVSAEALVLEVQPRPPPASVTALGPLRAELRLANGGCYTKGCIEEEAAYSSYYTPEDYPITKVLRHPLYVEVRFLERTDPNLVLTLKHCWATSTADPASLPHWTLLVDGCPQSDDYYQTSIVPVDDYSGLQYPTHYKRFIVRMFSFVDGETYAPMRTRVFIHCSTAACLPTSTGTCNRPCHRRQRRAAVALSRTGQKVVSSGEVIFTSPPRPFFLEHSGRPKSKR